MSMQIFFDQRNPAAKPAPLSAGVYAENLEELRLGALALAELVVRERDGTFDGVGANFWIGSDRVLDKARRLLLLAEQRAASLKDGSFQR